LLLLLLLLMMMMLMLMLKDNREIIVYNPLQRKSPNSFSRGRSVTSKPRGRIILRFKLISSHYSNYMHHYHHHHHHHHNHL